MSAGGWQLALRLAWRDALATKLRTLLVVALIGLPVLVLTVVDIGYRTFQLDPQETVSRTIGTADVGIQWSGLDGDVQQGSSGWLGNGDLVTGSPTDHLPTSTEVATLLPRGTRIIPWRVADNSLTFRTTAGLAQTQFTGLDLADPLTRGMARISSGRAPRTTAEVALTTRLAATSGLHLGDTLHALDPARSFHVVGLVTDGTLRNPTSVYALPAAVGVDATQVNYGADVLGWLGHTAGPVTWPDVRQLNRAGFVVLSRSEYLHPSAAARAAGTALAAATSGVSSSVAVPVALIAGMALLEVVLLAGPAFAVGAKRRRRDLALLAATGATERQLQRVVLCSGAVLGVLAGVVGVGLGTAVARVGEPQLATHVADRPGHFDVRPWELLGLLALALVTALLASVAPARAAARTEVVAALAGRRGDTRVRRRTPVLGLILVGIGVTLTLTASVGQLATTSILGGVALVELGLIACTPSLIVLAARAGRRLPLPARLALRDAGRNRSAATPAVAAVMAAVIGATALLLGVAGQDDRDRRQYTPRLPDHAVSADVQGAGSFAAAGLAGELRRILPASGVAVVRGFPHACPAGVQHCSVRSLAAPDESTSRVAAPIGDTVIVSDGSDLTTLFGRPRPDVRAALRAGKAVAADAAAVRGATVALTTVTSTYADRGSFTTGESSDAGTVHVPAVAVTSGFMPAQLIVPTSVAAQLKVAVGPLTVFARDTRAPTDAQLQAARAAYRRVVPLGSNLYVEQGYQSPYGTFEVALVSAAVLIAVLGAVVATALANVDGREDLRTLGAVGASPRVRRSLSSARAGVIAALGTLVGVPAGALIPLALLRQSRSGGYDASSALHFVVPWTSLAALVAVVPLLSAVIAGAVTRSRLPTGAAG